MESKEENFEIQVLTRLTAIETKLDDYKKIEDITYRAYNNSKQNEQDIKEIKENNQWLKRTIIGEVIGLVFLAIAMYIGLK